MARGRPPKPTALKEAADNPGNRPLNQHEPKPPQLEPGQYQMPAWMSEAGQQVWKEAIPILDSMGVMTIADTQAVGAMCETVVLWQRSLTEYRTEKNRFMPKGFKRVKVSDPVTGGSMEVDVPTGLAMKPVVREFVELSALMLRYYSEFGLTPSSRTRIEAIPPTSGDKGQAESDAKEAFFRSGSGVPPALAS